MTDNGDVRPRVDYERRVFVCRDGTELRLKPVSSLILERLNADQSDKPKVPIIETEVGGKHKRKEENPNDPEYLGTLTTWRR